MGPDPKGLVSLGEEIRRQTHTGGNLATTQGKDGGLQAKETGLRRNQPYQDLDLRLPVSRTGRKLISVVSAAQSAVLCFGSPGKLIRSMFGNLPNTGIN